MPPDQPRTLGGASLCVRDTARVAISPVHVSAAKPSFSYFPDSSTHNIFPPSPPITPSSSPAGDAVLPSLILPFTTRPILTPRSSTDSLSSVCSDDVDTPPASFLASVFPKAVDSVARNATLVPSTRPRGWALAVYDCHQMGTRTLYAKPEKVADDADLRDNIVQLLEKADEEELDCDALVVILNKNHKNLANVIHSLLYVGGSIVLRPALPELEHAKDYVLVGIDV